MLSQELVLVINGDELIVSFEREKAAGMGGGDAIAVGFELDQRLGSAFNRGCDSDIIIPFRQGDETGLFLPDKQIDGLLLGGAVDSAVGDLVSPGESM